MTAMDFVHNAIQNTGYFKVNAIDVNSKDVTLALLVLTLLILNAQDALKAIQWLWVILRIQLVTSLSIFVKLQIRIREIFWMKLLSVMKLKIQTNV